MELGYFQKDALIEKLAKKFYALLGYVVRDDYRMQSATHPAVHSVCSNGFGCSY